MKTIEITNYYVTEIAEEIIEKIKPELEHIIKYFDSLADNDDPRDDVTNCYTIDYYRIDDLFPPEGIDAQFEIEIEMHGYYDAEFCELFYDYLDPIIQEYDPDAEFSPGRNDPFGFTFYADINMQI